MDIGLVADPRLGVHVFLNTAGPSQRDTLAASSASMSLRKLVDAGLRVGVDHPSVSPDGPSSNSPEVIVTSVSVFLVVLLVAVGVATRLPKARRLGMVASPAPREDDSTGVGKCA